MTAASVSSLSVHFRMSRAWPPWVIFAIVGADDSKDPVRRQSAFTSSNSTILVAPVIGTMTPGDFTIILSPSRRKK